ncbi:DEAD/DEAH box helicase family protein [Akkermansiaceae bacterium]|nr:DEAD/DEAH box helicase family protein [Akkermansiaceae bacterium]MDC0286053.1 DEAD/DEAH box helicase family protein [Akkermansiaceae bacterium]
MNEADTRAELIDPALKEAGWGVVDRSRVKREENITAGRIQGAGRRGEQSIADYVLYYKGHKLAVIEAKSKEKHVTEGLGQAKKYAQLLGIRYTYSTNGVSIYRADMETGAEGEVDRYPTPDELWDMTHSERLEWRELFGEVPYQITKFEPRYYQHNAISKALEKIAQGSDRILLTLATGTGKTVIAFQLAWKLFHSRWNLGGKPTRRPRILFLADRNILANQAFNSFSDFPEDALVRIAPSEIRKKGQVPKNGSIFFTIFQTFMSGTDAEGNSAPYFGEYPEDFFDFIVIDECHRGGANDQSNWRGILDYFSPAVQLGLTATPKRDNNADTYAYFGEPVYIYSLKEGINDGFLTPFRVKQIETTLDEYVYTSDDTVEEGEVEEGREYKESDFNRIIEIKEREEYRVKLLMEQIDHNQKTIVFCATQNHALAVRDLINQITTSTNPDYCARVTASDGKIGEQHLKIFQDNEKTIPTILTTSQKLSTGVDARNVRNIVLMRTVHSMIEFKQIIGRGTRLYEGKDYFTVYDFVKAYRHFQDPEWDGEPLQPDLPTEPVIPGDPPTRPRPDEPEGEGAAPQKIKIKLADGKERLIQNMIQTSFWSPDGTPISAPEFVSKMFGDLPALFTSEAELRRIWGNPDSRKTLLQGLEDKGYGLDELNAVKKAIEAEKSDIFDVLAYISYALPTITREQRVEDHKEIIFNKYSEKQQRFINFVLQHYVNEGVRELDIEKLPDLLELKYDSIPDAVTQLGNVKDIRDMFVGFQEALFSKEA